jgi:SP family arabinose:H+ symporter-like MFS transporter
MLGRKRIFVLLVIMTIGNQMCGIDAVLFYAKQVFNKLTHEDKEMVKIYLLGLGLFQFLMTFTSSFALDRFGRRSLMLFGDMFMIVSLLSAYIVTDILNLSPQIVIIFVFLHIFGYAISMGPVTCIYAS